MKYLIIILLTLTSTISFTQSLSEKTGETNSLWNALAIEAGVYPSTWTVSEFRLAAKEYAESIGLEYTNHATNGWNNVEILHFSVSTQVTDLDSIGSEDLYIAIVNDSSSNFTNDTASDTSSVNTISIDSISNSISLHTPKTPCTNCASEVIKTPKQAYIYYKQQCKLARTTKGETKKLHIRNAKASHIHLAKLRKKVSKKHKRFRPKKHMPFLSKKWINYKFGVCLK